MADLKRAFDKVVNKYGTLDVVLNNAGMGLADNQFLEALDPKSGDGDNCDRWQMMNRVNIDAVIYGTQLAVAEFKRANGGRGKKGVVVNTVSTSTYLLLSP